jgi:transcriptional regulator with XRE-family HTH domain
VIAIESDFTWRELGERIHQRRVTRGLSQQVLARAAGLTQNAIFRLEAGETNPQMTSLQQIASALGCTVRELLCGVPGTASQLSGRQNRMRAVIESGDQDAIRILDHGIEAAEVLLLRSERRRSVPSPLRKLVPKGEGRRSLAADLALNQPLVRARSEADDMPLMADPAWIKIGGRISRRSKGKSETR